MPPRTDQPDAGNPGLSGVLRLSAFDAQAFVNHLTQPAAEHKSYPRAWRTIVLLLLLTVLPRAVMAWRIPTVCSDGTLYIALAEQREQGVVDPAQPHGGGLYPRILAALHSAGLPWETAGEAWGVLCGSLVVLPLFGWVRRQFNDAVATVSCLIYAAHPELIEWSPEVIRDQTFWLCLVASLYFMWRGIVEVRLPFHLAAIAAVVVATLCRTEGLFLFIPYVGWNAARLRALRVGRRSLVLCLAAAVALPPVALVATGKGSVAVEAASRALYLAPLQRVQAWWTGAKNAVDEAAASSGESPVQIGLRQQLGTSLRTIERGLTEVLSVLILVGMLLHWRLVLRSDQLPLLLLCFAVAGGVWIHTWFSGGEASSRYGLTIAILGTRFAALALLRGADYVWRRSAQWSWKVRTATVALPVAAYSIVGWCDALSTQYDSRVIKADLGHWIRNQYGADCRLAGVDTQLSIVGFYAEAKPSPLAPTSRTDLLLEQIRLVDPDVVLLSNLRIPRDDYEPFLAATLGMGFAEARPELEHALRAGTMILRRDPLRR